MHHGLAVYEGAGDGLFTVDVFAGRQGRFGRRSVEVVVHADIDGNQVVSRKQLVVVRVGVCYAELLAHPPQLGRVHVAGRYDLCPLDVPVIAQMVFSYLPYADNADSGLFHGLLYTKNQGMLNNRPGGDSGSQL